MSLSKSPREPSGIDYVAIQNTIARYCIALDSKDFNLLDEVFTTDVVASYPYKDTAFTGRKTVADAIQQRLRPVTSQHAITTQHIQIGSDGKTANATSYFTGVHFGGGKWEGKDVTAWGQYIDTLVLVEGSEAALPGSISTWLISKREVKFFARRGEERVMDGE